jgi:hypothetical protein
LVWEDGAFGVGLRKVKGLGRPILSDMGFKKSLLYVGGLALATAGPITFFSGSDVVTAFKQNWLHSPATAAGLQQPASAAAVSEAVAKPVAYSYVDSLPLPSLSEVLRFDVTVEWVMRRWPRVTTGLPYLQLQGYRVPLVTGTGVADLAGSLTYYFNAQQQVVRITFHGTTGNPSTLVAMLASQYHFVRRLTNDPGLVVYETVDASNRPAGTAKFRSAKVVRADQPYNRFEVDLTIDRPE